jgi:hypothetical protein
MDFITPCSPVLTVQVGMRSPKIDVGVYMPVLLIPWEILGPTGRKGQVTEENSVMRSFRI